MGTQWQCPVCGSDNLNYGTIEFEADQCYFPRTCEKCKACWEEWYSMEYVWHYNLLDKNWDEINKEDLFDNKNYNGTH